MPLSRVNASSIADGTVVAAEIAAGAIETAKIADANVTTAKINDSAVTESKIADANVTSSKLATDLDLNNVSVDTISINSYSSNHFSLGDVTGTATLNVAYASYFSANATGNITWTFEVPTDNTKVRAIILELAAGGVYTQTWPATTRWPSGTAPDLVTTPGNVDVLVFITDDSGANWRGTISQSDSY